MSREESEASRALREALQGLMREAIPGHDQIVADMEPEDEDTYFCPACGWENLKRAPWRQDRGPSDEICPSCAIHFGTHDASDDIETRKRLRLEWRKRWIEQGYVWNSPVTEVPDGWDGRKQLARNVERIEIDVSEGDAVVSTGTFICPICGSDELVEMHWLYGSPTSYEICPCCGVRSGHDDFEPDFAKTQSALRGAKTTLGRRWIEVVVAKLAAT